MGSLIPIKSLEFIIGMDGYALFAQGPQDLLFTDTSNKIFRNTPKQYTDFSIDTVGYIFGKAPYLGTTQTFAINVKSLKGDLLSDVFLKFTLPTGQVYVENVGRSITQHIQMSLDSVEVESFDDDWLILKDQLFLDDDEKAAIATLVNKQGGDFYVPLDFFFSRRYSRYRKDKVNKPFLPLCAAYKNTLYVTIEFQTPEFLCGVAGVDISNVSIVFETITLTDSERLELLSSPQTVTVQRLYKEPVTSMTNATVQLNLTASYKVTLMIWFLRYQLYEDNKFFYNKRYDYGYITTDKFVDKDTDPFEYITIYVNGKEITDRFSGVNFFTWFQPTLCKLSSPTKKLYMYAFGLSPNEYNNSGTFDFQTTDSNSTFISMKIKPEFVSDLTSRYFLHTYHYGYSELLFSDGTCSRLEI
jgi:hypothetical protein